MIALPLALIRFGMLGALLAFAIGDLLRYATLVILKRQHELSFFRQDIFYTVVFIGLVVAMRSAAAQLDSAASFPDLWQAGIKLGV